MGTRTHRLGFAAIALGIAMAVPMSGEATVTAAYAPIEVDGDGSTTIFTVTFPFLSASHIKVTKITKATLDEVIQTRCTGGTNCHYNVKLPIGSVPGTVTLLQNPALANTHKLRIERVVPVTQTTAFPVQGPYTAAIHESAFDKLTMIAQQLQATAGTDGATAVNTHVGLADPHTQYLLLNGRAGGQTAIGGTAASNNLALQTTSNATKGKILVGSAGTELVVDDVNDRVGVGTATPAVALDVVGAGAFTTTLQAPTVQGGAASGDDLTLLSTTHATKGNINLGLGSTFDDQAERLGIGDLTPDVTLDVVGTAEIGSVEASQIVASTAGTTGTITKKDAGGLLQLTGGGTGANLQLYGSAHASAGKAALSIGTSGFELFSVLEADEVFVIDDDDGNTAVYGYVKARRNIITVSTTYTIVHDLTQQDCGSVLLSDQNNSVITLPDAAAANKGCEVTVVNNGANGAALLSISPHASDGIYGSCSGTTTTAQTQEIIFCGNGPNGATSVYAAVERSGEFGDASCDANESTTESIGDHIWAPYSIKVLAMQCGITDATCGTNDTVTFALRADAETVGNMTCTTPALDGVGYNSCSKTDTGGPTIAAGAAIAMQITAIDDNLSATTCDAWCSVLFSNVTTSSQSFTGTANKDIQNARLTHVKGDYATLVSDGTGGWYVAGCQGAWASEP